MTPPPSPTWLYGPNRRFPNLAGPHPAWLARFQLLALEPGEFWVPALEPELLTPIALQPLGPPFAWRAFSDNFSWNLRWTPFTLFIVVRWLSNFSSAFEFVPKFLVQQQITNRLTTPAGNYAINGKLNFQWGPI